MSEAEEEHRQRKLGCRKRASTGTSPATGVIRSAHLADGVRASLHAADRRPVVRSLPSEVARLRQPLREEEEAGSKAIVSGSFVSSIQRASENRSAGGPEEEGEVRRKGKSIGWWSAGGRRASSAGSSVDRALHLDVPSQGPLPTCSMSEQAFRGAAIWGWGPS